VPHPLDGARLKVVRAQEHLDSLKAEIGMYLEEHPYEIVVDQKSYVTTVVVTTSPPLRLSTLVGDVVTNARAALDYIVSELALQYFNPPFDSSDFDHRRTAAFPIHRRGETARYTNHLNRLQKLLTPTATLDVPTLAVAEIQASQTYDGLDVLGWLHHLVNTDKHRTPLLTVSCMDSVYIVFDKVTKVRVLAEGRLRTSDVSGQTGALHVSLMGDHTHRVTIDGNQVKMDVQPTVRVALDDVSMPHEPVDRTLQQIIETVASSHVLIGFSEPSPIAHFLSECGQ
jgi:hypothetical protein